MFYDQKFVDVHCIENQRKAALTKLNKIGTDYEYFCGGVLIDDETILTGTKQDFSLESYAR